MGVQAVAVSNDSVVVGIPHMVPKFSRHPGRDSLVLAIQVTCE